MTEKIKEILDEVKQGKRKSIFGLNISLEEFLSKDSQGITFLEHLLKNKITIDILSMASIKNSIEAGYIYVENGESLFWFDYEEETLFSEFNDERFIDYIVRKNKLTNKMISKIKNHTEIVDILLKNNIYMCDYITKEIIEKLMMLDPNRKYYIEKYFDSDDSIRHIIALIDNPNIIITLCKKYNKYHLLEQVNEQALMYEIDENYTLLDDLLKRNIIPKKLTDIPATVEFINFLREKGLYEYLCSTRNENVLLTKIDEGKTLLEEIIDKGYSLKTIYLSKEETIRILYNKNKLEFATNIYTKHLLELAKVVLQDESLGDMTLIEYMLDNGYNPLSSTYSITDEKIIKIFYDRGDYEFLSEKISGSYLLLEIESGVSIIDKLLDQNLNIRLDDNGSEGYEIAKKLYERKRFDLLANQYLNILLQPVDFSNTYLDYVLEEIKEKRVKYNLEDIKKKSISGSLLALFYIIVAKHDMINYTKELEENDLLEEMDGKTLLEDLLDLNSKLTLDKILSNRVKSKLQIATIIKSRGLNQEDIDVPVEEKDFTEKYLGRFNDTWGIGPLLDEGESLLKELEDLFLQDGKSDKSLISGLISGYRQSLFENYKLTIQELKNLVTVKKNNFEKFIYVKEKEGAFFSQSKGFVNSERPVIDTLLHETGHALHYYLADSSVPEEYQSVIERIRANKNHLEKVEEFARNYSDMKLKIKEIVAEGLDSFFKSYYSSDRMLKIQEFLSKSKIEKQQELISLGLQDGTVNKILNNSFTVDEYSRHQKRIFVEEYTDDILRNEYGPYMAICDILDAIYEGELHSGVLKNKENQKIAATAGHGIYYYLNTHHGFDEMVANFAFIVKSKNSRESLDLLRSMVGDELYIMLSEFYYNNIVVEKSIEAKTL